MPASFDNLDCESLGSTLSSPPSPGSPVSPAHSLHRLDRKSSVRPYQSKDAYLYAMKEDLAVWFNDLYNTALTADNLLDNLRDGTFLCLHANNVKSYIEASSHTPPTNIPDIHYRAGAKPGGFQARDNLANFINWVKSHLGVNDVLLFESDDLVLMKNEKNVILCILEVARRGARYGMLAPMLVQFEQEIDELEQKIKRAEGRRNSQGSMSNEAAAANSDTDSDKASLDDWVQSVMRRCTCPKQFPLINVSRGKYRIGYSQNTVFVRILRKHVMIRVGGGWDTLEHYMDKHDPCRCLKSNNNNNGPVQRPRRRTSTAKDSKHSIRNKSPMMNRTRSQSVSSLNVTDEQTTPIKSNRSGSADLLSNDLIITRSEGGRHSIDDSSKTKEPKISRRAPLSVTRNNNNQNSFKSRQSSVRASPIRDVLNRSSSPSHDLVKKWKDTFKAQSSNTAISEVDVPASRDSSKNFRKTLVSRPSQRPRSYSRTRNCSSDRTNPRSRSYSRATTPSPSRGTNGKTPVRKASVCASPRKDQRHSPSAQPTRIPGPVAHNSNSVSNTNMISSTSTCNSSMDSLKTI